MAGVEIRWTETARQALSSVPPKVRRGLIDKAAELGNATDPSAVHKPLSGALTGYFRLPYGRYRAIFTIEKSGQNASGRYLVRSGRHAERGG